MYRFRKWKDDKVVKSALSETIQQSWADEMQLDIAEIEWTLAQFSYCNTEDCEVYEELRPRTPWRNRKVPNSHSITDEITQQYLDIAGKPSPVDFLRWLGLKPTPTAWDNALRAIERGLRI